jgi:hypothetical protein
MIGRITSPLLVLVALAGCRHSEPPRAADSVAAPSKSAGAAMAVAPDGFGAVHTGATVAQLSAAIGTVVPPAAGRSDAGCRYVVLSSLPSGMRVMIVNDTVARIDVDAAGVRTTKGAGVGDPEAHVLELYRGQISVEPHKYTGPTGHNLVVTSAGDSLHRIIFETDGASVLRYHAGLRPAVELVEGCG